MTVDFMKNTSKKLLRVGGLAFLSVTLLSGCASIVSKSSYPVVVDSNPEGATVSIRNAAGHTVHSGTTPMTVSLGAGAGYFRGSNYTVHFQKDGFSPATSQIQRNVDGWYFGNFIFGGLIGMIVVDPITGAMWRLSDVHQELTPLQSSIGEGLQLELQFLTLDEVPENLRDRLVLIN